MLSGYWKDKYAFCPASLVHVFIPDLVIDAAFGEILTTCSMAQWLIKNGERTLRTERRGGNLLLAHKFSTVQYEPLGVVSAIVSWNYREFLSSYP